MLNRVDTQQLIDRYARTRSIPDRDQVVAAHLYIADIIARKFTGRGVDYDDLYQVASLALVKAAERFDPDRGVKFVSFVTPSMAGEVKNYFRDRARTIRVPRSGSEAVRLVEKTIDKLTQQLFRSPTPEEVAEESGMPLESVIEALEMRGALRPSSLDDSADAEGDMPSYAESVGEDDRGYSDFEQKDTLSRAMAVLTEDEKHVMRERYYMGRSQRDIAEMMGVSQMTVSRMEKRALEKMRQFLSDDGG